MLRPDWMEFKDYGVSGSGKTSVLVHRALRLAEMYPSEKILVITLNPALSKLLENLIIELLIFKKKPELKGRIEVTSFWKLCRDKLLQFKEGEPLINKKYESKGYKDGNIKQIWSEFYLYQQDSFTAEKLFPIHQSLLSRNVNPKKYIKDEFDWLRSAYNKNERQNYLTNEREGRSVVFTPDFKGAILEGLDIWEAKMNFVGISDYMNLTTELYPYKEQIQPEYRCVLIDEVQDFGTTELQIIRKLAIDNPNNFFLAGDLAQQVYAKSHKIRNAGFNILPEAYLQILKNYRNSREILDAAYHMFSSNVEVDQIESEDFKILRPEYANFSSPKPFLRRAVSLNHEINSAIHYLTSLKCDGKKSCIAICGLGYFSILKLGAELQLKVLDGTIEINSDDIFLSDLEQTKGFEFDRMIILNVCNEVFPNPTLPKEEVYRDICKLYVAMTRAKKELILSYSNEISVVLDQSDKYFTQDSWSDHIDDGTYKEVPIHISDDISNPEVNLQVKGKEFILNQNHIQISKTLQDKLIETVTGKSLKGRRDFEWRTILELFNDLNARKNIIQHRHFFGPTTYEELLNLKRQLFSFKTENATNEIKNSKRGVMQDVELGDNDSFETNL